jgi:hypothetical protein
MEADEKLKGLNHFYCLKHLLLAAFNNDLLGYIFVRIILKLQVHFTIAHLLA